MRAVLVGVGLLGALVRPVAATPDCAGGTLVAAKLGTKRIRVAFTVTRAGLTPATLVGAGGLDVALVAADEGARAWHLALPAERFVAGARRTTYDGGGAFDGTVSIRSLRSQGDTVRVTIRGRRAPGPRDDVGPSGRAFRVVLGGSVCARTCVGRCTLQEGRGRCARSLAYEPFDDAGYGGFRKARRTGRSAYCGLALDPRPACDFLIDDHCLLPYPSSHFLVPDPSTPTGRRVHYAPGVLPANVQGVPIDPTDWNGLDGFSPGPVVLALFPDTGSPVDLEASGVAFHTNFARSLEGNHPTVLLDVATGTRVLHFAEMDARTTDVARQALILRPGRRLDDGRRYVVGIRRLVDTTGAPIAPRLAFRALRDGAADAVLTGSCGAGCAARIADRRTTFEDVFAALATAGIPRSELVLAWDFTTASTAALTGWMRAIRDQAFALPTPAFTVGSVDDGPGNAGYSAHVFRRVEGTFEAPRFTTADAPGARLHLVDGVPRQNGYASVPFVVDIPYAAANPGGTPAPARATLWGHGLLGDRYQLDALEELASGFGFVLAAVDMQGMSEADVPAIVELVGDFSLFHRIPERLHQGFLNHLLLGRLLADPVAGFNAHPAFRFGSPATGIVDTSQVFYAGGSQGGIFGVAIMAIATNFTRGFLAVPGANYSTLLHRSIDFNPFFALVRTAYPDPLDQQLLLALAQQQWDRAEPQGYLPHLGAGDLSDPPVPHAVLIHMATHDAEVSNLATEIMVRSLGIPQVTPVHRSFVGIPEMAAPYAGSGFVEIDPRLGFSRCNVPAGESPGAACTTAADCPGPGDPPGRTVCDSGVPPLTNTPPPFNNRAHGSTGSLAAGRQIDAFLRADGTIDQFCDGPCDPE